MNPKENTAICDIEFQDQCVYVVDFKKACKYHSKRNEVLSKKSLSPKGMCPHLFHRVYPYALALLYNANLIELRQNRPITIVCPALKSSVSIEVYRERQNSLAEMTKNFLKGILVLLNLHCNPLYYRVFMKVIKTTGRCRYSHNENEIFEFNIGDSAELCPAAFDAIFPQMLKQEGNLPVMCPDHLGKVSFLIRKENGE